MFELPHSGAASSAGLRSPPWLASMFHVFETRAHRNRMPGLVIVYPFTQTSSWGQSCAAVTTS